MSAGEERNSSGLKGSMGITKVAKSLNDLRVLPDAHWYDRVSFYMLIPAHSFYDEMFSIFIL